MYSWRFTISARPLENKARSQANEQRFLPSSAGPGGPGNTRWADWRCGMDAVAVDHMLSQLFSRSLPVLLKENIQVGARMSLIK